MHKGFYLIVSAMLSIAGCSGSDRVTQQTSTNETAATADANIKGQQVRLLSTLNAPHAFPLNPGSSISGRFKPPVPGTVTSLSVQIGNYSNTVDGNLTVELCQRAVCQEGSADLTHSVDNHALNIVLDRQLSISANTPVRRPLIVQTNLK